MIPIKIEATNPSNIGAYKNTPFQQLKEPRKHTRPMKGSYKDWVDTELTESKHVFLEDMNLTNEELINAVISEITQNPRYSYISYWIDNEVDDAAMLQSNVNELHNLVSNKFLAKANKYFSTHSSEEVNATTICKICRQELIALNEALKEQYGEVK